MKGLDRLNDEFNERSRGEELAAPLPLAHREVTEKVLVDLSEGIAFNVHRNLFHDAEEFKEGALFEAIVSFG